MKMIKPIVNISKVIDNYKTVIVGFNGVLSDGRHIYSEALNALINIKKRGMHIVLVSNTPARVVSLARFLHQNKVPLALFDTIVTAGEVLHFRLKNPSPKYAVLGNKYFHMGNASDKGVFAGLGYEAVPTPERADFIYMSAVGKSDDIIENYRPILEQAAALKIPFLCAGNDTSCYMEGKISLAPGAFAEQYAVLGGQIITLGKPDSKIFEYALEGVPDFDAASTLLVGDNLASDIKAAAALNIAAALVSKGVHVNYLGEGYIPDVAKTRELAANFNAYPDYVISNVRW